MKALISILILFILFSVSCNKNTSQKTDKKPLQKTKKELRNRKKIPDLPARSVDSPRPHQVEIKHREDIRVLPDTRIEKYLEPYRKDLKKKTEKIIAELKIDLTKDGDSHTLGRFCSQVILEKARQYSKLPVDFSILNNGGLRKPLYKGKIKIKDIYELMPFDNYIMIISLNGKQVKKICKEIIKHHGLPMAGIEILTGHTSKPYCKINGKEINDNKNYLIATINYLYKVGEGVPTLKKGKLVKNMTNHLFRDALIEYFKEKKVIENVIPVNYKYIK